MKKILSPINISIIIILFICLFATIFTLVNTRKQQQSSFMLVYIAQVRSALSTYLAEHGTYPIGNDIVLGSATAAQLCAGADLLDTGLLSHNTVCNGEVLIDFSKYQDLPSVRYTGTTTHYQLSFSLKQALGSFTHKGPYCATERGILIGQCN